MKIMMDGKLVEVPKSTSPPSDCAPPEVTFYFPDGRFVVNEKDYGNGVVMANPKDETKPKMVRVAVHIGDRLTDVVTMMVTEEDWKARLTWVCPHRLQGWACKECLAGEWEHLVKPKG